MTDFEQDIRASIEAFFRAVTDGAGDELDRLATLAKALDGLVQAYNSAPETEPDEFGDAPRQDVQPMLSAISDAFPSIGLYADVDPTGDFTQEMWTGDAIDDLSDIARDLADVIWYFEKRRPETAIWDFRFGYQSHWGRHLHDVRRYLHSHLN